MRGTTNATEIRNKVTRTSYDHINATAGVITYPAQITIPAAGTYLLMASVYASQGMGSGLSVKGFNIGGSLAWVSTNAATGDGQYATVSRVITLAAGTVVQFAVYFSAQDVWTSGELSATLLE